MSEIQSYSENTFENIKHLTDEGVEFWYARDLQEQLGYSQWRSFEQVIEKAIIACENSQINPSDHFARARKMVDIGSGAKREIDDIALTRYACYLIAQNGDPTKEPIAFAQTYFAVQTRKMEVIEQRLAELERLNARQKLTESERLLSSIIFERLGENQSFARIRSKGDSALFGGLSLNEMELLLGLPRFMRFENFASMRWSDVRSFELWKCESGQATVKQRLRYTIQTRRHRIASGPHRLNGAEMGRSNRIKRHQMESRNKK